MNNRVVKGTNFVDLRDAGDPVEVGALYSESGADELVFLDITASSDARDIKIDMVRRVAERVSAGGHDVDPEKIEPRYKRTMGFLAQYYDIADFIAVYDNSIDIAAGGQPRLLVTKGADGKPQATTHCDDVRWIHKYLLDVI